MPIFWSVLIINGCWILSKTFSASIEMIRRRQWHPTPVLLPRKSHGRRSLVGCSPWGRKQSDRTSLSLSLSCTGEGNGNPLQCSCLENPRDRGAWWAAVYGVTQSRTWLKWLSSSSSSSIEMIIWFLSFNLLIWCITLIDWHILKNPCIPGINPTWSWCMSFLMCCWVLFVKFCWEFLHLCSP